MKRDHLKWTDEQLQWFTDNGCKWVKPSLDPGDFILWDSREAHYGAGPMGTNKRMAVCTYLSIDYVSAMADVRQTPATSLSSS